MKYYRFPNTKLTVFGMFILIFSLLILVRDSLVSLALLDFTVSYALNLVILLIFGIVFLIHQRKQLKKVITDRRILLAAICSFIMLIPMVIKKDWQIMYFSILLGTYIAIFFSLFMTMEEAAKYYVVILSLLAGYSMFAHYVLKPMALSGIISPPEFVNSIGNPFYNFGFSYVPTWFWWYRNNGIFREPGVYQFFLIVALYLNNFSVSWTNGWRLWLINLLLAATMLSTYSTNGIVELSMLVFVIFFEKKYYKNRFLRLTAVIALLIGILVCAYSIVSKTMLYGFLEKVFSKLFSSVTNSTSARVESVIVDAKFFLASPIFGEKISTVLYAVVDNTSSTMILFAIYGIAGGVMHIASWTALVWDKNRHLLLNLILLMTMLMSFNTQNLTWDNMFWLFPMMALTEKVVPWLEKKFPQKC